MGAHATAVTSTPASVKVRRCRSFTETPIGKAVIVLITLLPFVVVVAIMLFRWKAKHDVAIAEAGTHLELAGLVVVGNGVGASREGPAPFVVQFTAVYKTKDSAGAPWRYRWAIDDETFADTEVVSAHTFTRGGTYEVSFTATSVERGWSGTAKTVIVVTGNASAPSGSAQVGSGSGFPTLSDIGAKVFGSSTEARPPGEIIQAHVAPGEALWVGTISVGHPSPWFELDRRMYMVIDTNKEGRQRREKFNGDERFIRWFELESKKSLPASVFAEPEHK